jgi:hypothetical protein
MRRVSPRHDKILSAIADTPMRKDASISFSQLIPGCLKGVIRKILPDLEIITYFTAPNERRHGLNAIIASRGEATMSSDYGAHVRHMFFCANQSDLLAEAHGTVPHGLIGYLRGQDALCLQPAAYMMAHRLFSRVQSVGASCSPLMQLDEGMIVDLAGLPDVCFQPRLVRDLAHCRNPRQLGLLVVALESTDYGTGMVRQAAHDASSFSELSAKLLAGYEGWPFPTPPIAWPSLVPLSDAAALKATAKRMKNCLASRIPEVLREEEYYLLWQNSDQELVCQILPDRPIGWRIGDILGPENEKPDRRIHAAAVRDLEAAGARKRPSVESLLRAAITRRRIDDEDDLLLLDLIGE